MKPDYEKIIDTKSRSFISRKVKRENRPLLTAAWHFHPEIEICFTQKSNGKRYVGNNISDYHEGDLVMLGSNLPHGFTTVEVCKQTVIQLRYDFLGDGFFNQPELYQIRKLISNSLSFPITFSNAFKSQHSINVTWRKEELVYEGLPVLRKKWYTTINNSFQYTIQYGFWNEFNHILEQKLGNGDSDVGLACARWPPDGSDL